MQEHTQVPDWNTTRTSQRLELIRQMKRLLFTLLLLSVSGCALIAPQQLSTPEEGSLVIQYDVTALEFPPLRDVALPEVEEVELPNGLKLFITEDHSLPRVSISARIGAGALWEPADKVGLAGITGTVMRSGGTTSLSPDELNLALENVGASIETSIGDDSGFAFMSTLTEHIDTVLPLFADVLMNPAFDAGQVELAKTRVKSGISRRNDNPQGIATRELFKLVFGADSPYARDTEYWTIDAITRDDLDAFHQQYFHPNNTSLAVWGDFDATEMANKIRVAFGEWERANGFERPEAPPVDTSRESTLHFVQKDDVTQSTVLIGHPGEIQRNDPDYFPVIVMNEILGGGFSSRLFQTVRTDLGLAYAVWGNYSADYETPGVFYAGTFTKSESTTDAVRAMQDVIGSMRTTAPSEEELFQAKEAYLNSFIFNFDTKQEVLNRQMTYGYYGYPADFVQQIKAGVEAVTAEDVQRVAQRYLYPDEAHILVLGNAADFSEPISSLGEVAEIDITIPLQQPGVEHAPTASNVEGVLLLNRVIEALGSRRAFAEVKAVRYEAETQAVMGGQAIELQTEAVFDFPDRIYVKQRTRAGAFEIIVNGSEGVMRSAGGAQAAPAALVSQIRDQIYMDLAYLLSRADDLVVAAQDGKDGLDILQIGVSDLDGPLFLYIDPESSRPVKLQMTLAGMEGPQEMLVFYDDYRQTGALLLPYATRQVTNGEEGGSSVSSLVQINPEFDDALFELGN